VKPVTLQKFLFLSPQGHAADQGGDSSNRYRASGLCRAQQPTHPRGRNKARVFRDALDIRQSDVAWLRDVLLDAARLGQALQAATDTWGTHWRLDVTVRRHGKNALVGTIWIVRTGENAPRFVTCWVL
jgi:hypothetical protein